MTLVEYDGFGPLHGPIRIEVLGTPVPEGSTKAIPYKSKDGATKVAIMHNKSSELMDWRYRIAKEYRENGGTYTEQYGIDIHVEFFFTRPKSVKAEKRPNMTVKPDVDKLLRAVMDALTGVAYKDDSQVVSVTAVKRYGKENDVDCACITVSQRRSEI